MDTIEPIDQGFAWTAARIATVTDDRLEDPTPCSRWDLRELLDHTIGSLAMLTDALDGGAGTGDVAWDRAIAALAEHNHRAWRAAGVMDRPFDLPIGAQPGPVMASVTVLETVVHGWDISQATGEAADIPDALAIPTLAFARQAVPEDRGDDFAADLGLGGSPSDELVPFLGRKSL